MVQPKSAAEPLNGDAPVSPTLSTFSPTTLALFARLMATTQFSADADNIEAVAAQVKLARVELEAALQRAAAEGAFPQA